MIPPENLKMETYPPVQKGAQHVGSPTGIRIEHIPSGLVAICNIERSQHKNRAVAMDMLMGGLTSSSYRGTI